MDFSNSIEALRRWRAEPAPTAFGVFSAICHDLSPANNIVDQGPIASTPDDPLFRPFSHLSWWGGDTRARLTDFTGAGASAPTGIALGTEYDLAWLDIALGPEVSPARIPEPTLRAFHEALVRGIGGEDTAVVGRLRDTLVLFVTTHGRRMDVPDLYVAGPARQEAGADNLVGVLQLHLSKAVGTAAGDVKVLSTYLARLQGLAKGAGGGAWRSLFGSTGEVRDRFRQEMAKHLASLMTLVEETVGHRAADDGLPALREAATLIVFRLMFLMELEGRRGLLYAQGQRPEGQLSLFELCDPDAARRGGDSLLARLFELTRHIP